MVDVRASRRDGRGPFSFPGVGRHETTLTRRRNSSWASISESFHYGCPLMTVGAGKPSLITMRAAVEAETPYCCAMARRARNAGGEAPQRSDRVAGDLLGVPCILETLHKPLRRRRLCRSSRISKSFAVGCVFCQSPNIEDRQSLDKARGPGDQYKGAA